MTAPSRLTEHVYWFPPGPPDRPSLCAVAGDRHTIWLDAGSSARHTGEFLRFLTDAGVARPSHVVLTHSHWDHVFGADALGAHVVAHVRTADYVEQLAATDWSDEALDRRVASGESSPAHAENVKAELPAPREVRIAPVEIVFHDGLDIELGGARVRVRHLGGDHADDSSVMYVEPDGLLFLGDCLYDAPSGGYTAKRLVPLIESVRDFGARLFVHGHGETVLSTAEIEGLMAEARSTVA